MNKRRFTLSLVSFALALATLFSFSSCALKIHAEELSAGYKAQAAPAGKPDAAAIAALEDFSMALFAGTVGKRDAALISPLSAVLCLGLITNAASGETLAQIENALGMTRAQINLALQAYVGGLYTADDCKVRTANSVWLRESTKQHVKPSFLQTNADYYDAQVYAAPFDSSTVRDINAWCDKQTDGMIKKIIDEIEPDTISYLVNALLFDAKWEKKYEDKDLKDRAFTNADGSETTVKMMYSEESSYLTLDGAEGVLRPYKGGKYAFLGLLPAEGTDVIALASSMTGEKWRALISSKQYCAVSAGIPEFTKETTICLNDALKGMGISDLFSPAACDVSDMYDDYDAYISLIMQKAKIEVDRNGTKAAAITWGTMKATSAAPGDQKHVILDRPFVYAIVDLEYNCPLFIGAVEKL